MVAIIYLNYAMNYFQNTFNLDCFQTKCSIQIDKLISLPILVPEIQREINQDRVDEIVGFQSNFYHQNKTLRYICDLTLAKVDEKFIIIDGFHRFSSMKHVYLLDPTYQIGLTLLHPSSLSHMSIEDIFLLMNKSEPVPHYIMQTTLDLNKRNIIDNFILLFTKKYKIYISKSKNPHRPNINIEVFLSKLVESEIFKLGGNAKEILDFFIHINLFKWKDMDTKKSLVSFEKANKHSAAADPLYMSNDIDNEWISNKDWINDFILHSNPQITYPKMSPLKKRKTFPKNLRMMVWTKYFSNESMKGTCSCCQYQIDYNTFELGHIISVCNGGTSTIENIVPICTVCNKSCGSVNLTDFAKQFNLPLSILI